MRKDLFVFFAGLFVLLASRPSDSRPHSNPEARRLVQSNCSNAHGWMRISTSDIVGDLSCFSPEINGHYASIGGGGVNERDDVGIQMNFLSRPGTHTCRVPTVLIEFREHINVWDAYRVRDGQFGYCTITQFFKKGHKLWKGHATANLVIVKGNVTSGSPTRLHSEKDITGKPLSRTIEIEWEFDRLFTPETRSPVISEDKKPN
jgi:hypothetical protein